MVHPQGLGYAISLAGFFWYNYIKMHKAPKQAPVTSMPPRRGEYTIVSHKDPEAQKGEV